MNDYFSDVLMSVVASMSTLIPFYLIIVCVLVILTFTMPIEWSPKYTRWVIGAYGMILVVVVVIALVSPVNTPKNTTSDRVQNLDAIERLNSSGSTGTIESRVPETPTTSREEVDKLVEY